jgi:hypothetical protein
VIRIPFHDITSICCQREAVPVLLDFPDKVAQQWMRNRERHHLVIKVARPEALAGLPTGKSGKGRLLIARGDHLAAKELVESIVRQPLQEAGRSEPRAAGSGSPAAGTADGTQMEVVAPAVGLLLTGALAAIGWYVGLLAFAHGTGQGGLTDLEGALYVFAITLGLAAAGVVVTGAVQMLRMRAYPFAVIAAVLALLPWSPGWLLGLPFGIWALAVLRRREVKAAFLDRRRREDSAGPKAGKLTLFFRSLAGYFLPSSVGRSAPPQPRVQEPDAPCPETPPPAARRRRWAWRRHRPLSQPHPEQGPAAVPPVAPGSACQDGHLPAQ